MKNNHLLNLIVSGVFLVTSGIAISDESYRDEYFDFAKTCCPILLEVIKSNKDSDEPNKVASKKSKSKEDNDK